MKRLIIISLLLFGSTVAFSQTLQFSQVLLVSNVQQTVPAGHVWKVESYWKANTTTTDYFNSTSCSSPSYQSPFYINGNYYYVLKNVATGSSYTTVLSGNDFPLWLPAGTTLRTVCSSDFLSVIEFTVIP